MLKTTSLPQFPRFQTLSATHQAAVESFTARFEPYSDFNFISLWAWDRAGRTQLARLGQSLVIKLEDYLEPNRYIYSFLGDDDLEQTALTLTRAVGELELVPAPAADPLLKKFVLSEQRAAFDYVIPVTNLADLSSGQAAKKRWSLNQFMRNYSARAEFQQIEPDSAASIVKPLEAWEKQARLKSTYNETEFAAIKKLLGAGQQIDLKNLRVLVCLIDGQPAAFSISEILPANFAMGHFKKSLRSYRGLSVALDMFTAQMLAAEGVQFINGEQDLGLEGLRKSKMSMRPERFLKKYSLKLR